VTKRTSIVLAVVGVVGLGAIGAGSAARSVAPATPCPKGAVAAKIAGKRACLKAGQKCTRSLDKQYHRYGFHCHTGRLAKATKPKPKPSDAFSRKVDVGGFRLAITCRGTGSPTVVLESGGGASATAWTLVEPTVAKTTRVCSYDRAGLGSSDPRTPPGPVQAAKVVEELHTLLAGAGISPPYVLGGWSLGGFFNRLYVKRYPTDVVGLVSVDGAPIGVPGEPSWLRPPGQPPGDLFPPAPGLPDAYFLAAADAELLASPGLGSLPFVVLTHGRAGGAPAEYEALWAIWQKRIALLSTSSMLVRADEAGHPIPMEQPDLTAEALRLVIAAVRANAPLPACTATALAGRGGTCLDPGQLADVRLRPRRTASSSPRSST
jgi:pimeloyl-ACP methyl ester carboxylesterase